MFVLPIATLLITVPAGGTPRIFVSCSGAGIYQVTLNKELRLKKLATPAAYISTSKTGRTLAIESGGDVWECTSSGEFRQLTQLEPPPGVDLSEGAEDGFVLLPDGRAGVISGKKVLSVISFGRKATGVPKPIYTSAHGMYDLSASPDGSEVAFSTEGRSRDLSRAPYYDLWVYSFARHSVQRLGLGRNAFWSDDGNVIYALQGTEEGGKVILKYHRWKTRLGAWSGPAKLRLRIRGLFIWSICAGPQNELMIFGDGTLAGGDGDVVLSVSRSTGQTVAASWTKSFIDIGGPFRLFASGTQ